MSGLPTFTSDGSGRVWPLIGREQELERIAQARAAGRSGVVVEARAGVGKSRLARAALAQAEQRGAVTLWVQATRSAASVPLGAFAGRHPRGGRLGRSVRAAPPQRGGDRRASRYPTVADRDRRRAAARSDLGGARASPRDRFRVLRACDCANWGAMPRCDRLVVEGGWSGPARARPTHRTRGRSTRRKHRRWSGRRERAPLGVGDEPRQPAVRPRADAWGTLRRSAGRGERAVADAEASATERIADRGDLRAPGRSDGGGASSTRAACAR
ncbi:MAG: AAA family ATPase [Solirubrobacteraceae bacterium]